MEDLVEEHRKAGKPLFPPECGYQGYAAVVYGLEFDDEGHSLMSTASVYNGGDMLVSNAIGLYYMHLQDLSGLMGDSREH